MAKGVVDAFETVEIEIDYGGGLLRCGGLAKQTLGGLDAALSIRQRSQRVEVSQPFDMFGGRRALARILAQHDNVATLAAVESQLERAVQSRRIVRAVREFALQAVECRLPDGLEDFGQTLRRREHGRSARSIGASIGAADRLAAFPGTGIRTPPDVAVRCHHPQ